VVQADKTTPYTHIELINGDWYRIDPYVYRDELFWIIQEDWLITSASTSHPANFTSPTTYQPCTITPRSSLTSEDENEPETAFPDPNTLEPDTISPGGAIAQDLELAPIFGDITESISEVAKGKQRESYLPLNLSPMIPK
jgi:hypothetical protein